MLNLIDYIIPAFLAFVLAMFLTPAVIWLARKIKVIDRPKLERKIHKKPTPLLGGLAIFLAVNILVALYYFYSSTLAHHDLLPKHLLGVLIGGLVLMLGGFLDDKYNLKPSLQFLFPLVAVISVIVSGIGIDWMANPLTGGIWRLNEHVSILFWFQGLPYKLTLFADVFTLIWLLAMMYTTKLLDGLDGLVSGVGVIASVFIFVTSIIKENAQNEVAILTLILGGAFLGFLLYNFNPAKIFLGEGGSLFAGFMIGVLSIISGSKVAVTLIVMGIPVLDVLWTIIRRLMEKKNPFKTADKKHLHHRLLNAGFNVRQAVLFLYLISLIFGVAAILLQRLNFGLFLLGLLVLLSFMLIMAVIYKFTKEKSLKSN